MVRNPTLALLCLDTLCNLFELGCCYFELGALKNTVDEKLYDAKSKGKNQVLY